MKIVILKDCNFIPLESSIILFCADFFANVEKNVSYTLASFAKWKELKFAKVFFYIVNILSKKYFIFSFKVHLFNKFNSIKKIEKMFSFIKSNYFEKK